MPRGVATLDCEYHSQAGWTIRGPPKMTCMGHMQVLWLQYGETVWNKGDGTSQGTTGVVLCNSFVGQRGPSRGIKGHIKGPMRSKTSFFGHKWVWWLQSGGTVWNKGGRSHCASVVMHRNSFVGQVGHQGSHGAPIGSKTAKNCPWNHTWIWWLQSGGSASIKVGYSKGIAQAIYWNNFLCTKG